MKRYLAIVFALVLCGAAPSVAPSPSGPWNAAVRDNMLTQIEANLRGYFFLDSVPALHAALESHRAALVAIGDPQHFADETTRVLQSVAHDKHLSIMYTPFPQMRLDDSPAATEKMRQFDNFIGHGLGVVARLHGNIGYFRIDGFSPESFSAKRTIDSAMKEVADTDALIIDLRDNHGGEPETVDYLLGYFFAHKTQVTGFLGREHGRITETPMYAGTALGAPKYLDRPVYVLTSELTFSGGEQFAYDIRNSKRATLVGSTTGGGANPGAPHPLTENFSIFVPEASAKSPITGTNWEGVGVTPDVKTTDKGALLKAYTLALRAAKDDSDFAVQGRARSLQDPAFALRDSLPEY